MQQGNGTYLREICILLLRCKSKKTLYEHEGGDKDKDDCLQLYFNFRNRYHNCNWIKKIIMINDEETNLETTSPEKKVFVVFQTYLKIAC